MTEFEAVVAALAEAWNSADAAAFARQFSADASFVDIKANRDEGRAAIEARHVWLAKTVFRGSRIAYDVLDVAELASGVMKAHVAAHVALADGSRLETLASVVFIRRDNAWQLALFHNTEIGAYASV